MTDENHIANQQENLHAPGTAGKPCIRASGLTVRRLVLAGCLLFWAVVLGAVFL